MTIGEKIIGLRSAARISQEQLAEKLSVSRQSVSKWEMDQALPQMDKILQLAELFGVTTDELLRDHMTIRRLAVETDGTGERKTRYFGTDGFRGEANVDVTAEQAFRIGRYLGWHFSVCGIREAGSRPKIVIGKDTRRSSYMLEYAIAAGLTASGADAYMLHVTTTPSVSYVTRDGGFRLRHHDFRLAQSLTVTTASSSSTATAKRWTISHNRAGGGVPGRRLYSVWGWTGTSFRWHAGEAVGQHRGLCGGAQPLRRLPDLAWHRTPTAR